MRFLKKAKKSVTRLPFLNPNRGSAMPITIPFRAFSLIENVKATFARRKPADDAIGLEIQRVLTLLEPLPLLTGRFLKKGHAITRYIEPALRTGNVSTASLLEAIAPVIHALPWRYSYPPRQDAPELGRNIAFAEIIGPEAPFQSDSVCLGLTLIGPETVYPPHRHPAIELYYVVGGTATWTLNGIAHDNPPGTYILHPSQGIHAMQTHAEPLLAVYTWSGSDVRTTSVYTHPALPDEDEHIFS
jgi:quercetin dioxygenase-like cupin family protein